MVRAQQTNRKSSEKTDKPEEEQQQSSSSSSSSSVVAKKPRPQKKIKVEKVADGRKKFRNTFKTTIQRGIEERSKSTPIINHASVHNVLSEAVTSVNTHLEKHSPVAFDPVMQISHDAVGIARYAVGVIGSDIMVGAVPFAARDRRLTIMPKDVWFSLMRNPWLLRTARRKGIKLSNYLSRRGRK